MKTNFVAPHYAAGQFCGYFLLHLFRPMTARFLQWDGTCDIYNLPRFLECPLQHELVSSVSLYLPAYPEHYHVSQLPVNPLWEAWIHEGKETGFFVCLSRWFRSTSPYGWPHTTHDIKVRVMGYLLLPNTHLRLWAGPCTYLTAKLVTETQRVGVCKTSLVSWRSIRKSRTTSVVWNGDRTGTKEKGKRKTVL